MSWSPDATVTIAGIDYTGQSLNGVTLTYGRSNVWEQARASYATINLINWDDVDWGFQPNDSVVIKVKNYTGTDVTVFTGKLSTVTTGLRISNSGIKVASHTLTAQGPFAVLARTIVSGSWAKEFDGTRVKRIFDLTSVTQDTVDTPGNYELTAKTAAENTAYQYAATYATMGFGYIFETTSGKVGYANEGHRTDDVNTNGYFKIPKSAILTSSIQSALTVNDIVNDVKLEYKANAKVTDTDATSIANYGLRGVDLVTELETLTNAQDLAGRYLDLRSVPRTSITSFTVQLAIESLTSSELNGLINVYMGKPIEIDDLPPALYPTTYLGFVEGWTMIINENTATLTLLTSESALSLVTGQWRYVNPATEWSDVTATIKWLDY